MSDVQTAIMSDINIVNAQFHFKGYLTGNIYNQKAKLSSKMLILNVLTPPLPPTKITAFVTMICCQGIDKLT